MTLYNATSFALRREAAGRVAVHFLLGPVLEVTDSKATEKRICFDEFLTFTLSGTIGTRHDRRGIIRIGGSKKSHSSPIPGKMRQIQGGGGNRKLPPFQDFRVSFYKSQRDLTCEFRIMSKLKNFFVANLSQIAAISADHPKPRLIYELRSARGG